MDQDFLVCMHASKEGIRSMLMQEEHEDISKWVLQCLREHKLYDKISKCFLFQSKIHLLGHVVSRNGNTIDPWKVEASIELHAPTNAHEVHSFMGLAI